MKNAWIVFVFLGVGFCGNIFAQNTPKRYPIEPTGKLFGAKFIYDRQSIHDPMALQIPILQLQDPEASREFLQFKAMQRTNKVLQLIPAAISIYTIFNREKVSDGFYWTSFGTSILVSGYIGFRANSHLTQSINRYNQVIGLSVQTTLYQPAMGLSWRCSF